MNETTLKFAPNRSCSVRRWVALHAPWVVVVGAAWMLTGVSIARVEAITVNELLPVMQKPLIPPEEAKKLAKDVSIDLKNLIQKGDKLAEQLGSIDLRKARPDKPFDLVAPEQTPDALPVFYISLKAIQEFQMPASSPLNYLKKILQWLF